MRKKALILTALFALAVAACGDGDGADTTQPVPGETTTSADDSNDTGGIHTAETDLGTILVDEDGFTLYVFTADSGGESACYEACADLWPPVPGDAAISGDLDSSMFGTTERTDGSTQLTVNDQPLYLYTPDQNPGDTTGQNVNGVWFVVDSSGSMIGGPDADAGGGTTASDNGYDY